MRVFHELERQEARVLGALRFLDGSTGTPLGRALDVRGIDAAPVRLQRNRSGLYVVHEWQPLAAHALPFEAPPPPPPALGSQLLHLAVNDPLGAYLPRRVTLRLPLNPDPAASDQPGSLFRPIDVPLYPAASATDAGSNWSLLRVSLSETGSGDALGGALLRVRRNGEVLARGLTDWRGEALVAVVGVPVATFSDNADAVVVNQIDVSLDAVFDPAIGLRTPLAAVAAGRAPQAPLLVDPEALEAAAGLPGVSLALPIAARRSQRCTLSIDLP